jgi:hypothetical protein
MGNAFVQDVNDGSVWLLDAGEGKIHPVADSVDGLKERLGDADFVNERFLVEDLVAAREAGKILAPGQVYGFVKPSVKPSGAHLATAKWSLV